MINLEDDEPKRPKKRQPYFGKPVEDAIIRYNKSTDKSERHRIYEETIHKALDELVQNNIFNALRKNSPYYTDTSYDDLRSDCVVYMYDRMQGYDPQLGRAFSYFNRISLNFLIANSQRVYKNLCDAAEINCIDSERDLIAESHLSETQAELRSFLKTWSNECIEKLEILFPNQKEQQVANAVFNLFENVEYLDIYNKKALYILIREQINCKTHTITKVVSEISEFFSHQYKKHLERVANDEKPSKNIKSFADSFIIDWIEKNKNLDLFDEQLENEISRCIFQEFKHNSSFLKKFKNEAVYNEFVATICNKIKLNKKDVIPLLDEILQYYQFQYASFIERKENVRFK